MLELSCFVLVIFPLRVVGLFAWDGWARVADERTGMVIARSSRGVVLLVSVASCICARYGYDMAGCWGEPVMILNDGVINAVDVLVGVIQVVRMLSDLASVFQGVIFCRPFVLL